MKIPSIKLKKAFTLTELLIVIGILTVLLAIVLVALNPFRQFSQANNITRRSDVKAILDATHIYMADNSGQLPPGITTTPQTIKNSGGVDLCPSLVSDYLADLPLDPSTGTKTPQSANCTAATSYDTGYRIYKSTLNNRITVDAPAAQLEEVIQATR